MYCITCLYLYYGDRKIGLNLKGVNHMTNIEHLNMGQFFKRKADAKKVYVYTRYCRFEKKYIGNDWDDISRDMGFKKGTKVFTEFDF